MEAARYYDGRLAGFVDSFAAQVRTDQWQRENSKNKFWLRSMLAAAWERDPFIFLGKVFNDPRASQIIPTNHRSFDDFAAILDQFARN